MTLSILFPIQQLMATLKPGNRLSSVILASALNLGVFTPSYASERIRWTPDAERGNVGTTLSGGRRGQTDASCNPSGSSLSLMVPGDRSRLLTTVATPTLAWHVTTTVPVSMTFHLSDPALATPIYSQTIAIDHTSTVSVPLPQEKRLTPDTKYRWTVLASCPGATQPEISARSFVELVDGESLNVDNLSSLEQASTYADRGIWYDAIASLLMARHQGVADVETMVQRLLEQSQSQAEVTLSTVVHF